MLENSRLAIWAPCFSPAQNNDFDYSLSHSLPEEETRFLAVLQRNNEEEKPSVSSGIGSGPGLRVGLTRTLYRFWPKPNGNQMEHQSSLRPSLAWLHPILALKTWPTGVWGVRTFPTVLLKCIICYNREYCSKKKHKKGFQPIMFPRIFFLQKAIVLCKSNSNRSLKLLSISTNKE